MSQTRLVHVSTFESDEEGAEDGEVLDVSCRLEASLELNLCSAMCS